MEKIEISQEFYGQQFGWVPKLLQNEIGHFNVFRLEPQLIFPNKPTAYRKYDYFKVSVVIGNSAIQYADKRIEIEKQALVFYHPLISYQWDETRPISSGYFFVFTPDFFRQYSSFDQYSVFQSGGYPIFELSDEQLQRVVCIFENMLDVLDSEYVYKYDALRSLVFELVHAVLSLQPSTQLKQQSSNASQRLTTLFSELLERQFPIDNPRQTIQLRSASDFANRLNVHVNHLNRSVRQVTQKTSTQLIAERLIQEAGVLLKQSAWTVSEIAHVLGFREVTYFNSFFKKHLHMSPGEFRHV